MPHTPNQGFSRPATTLHPLHGTQGREVLPKVFEPSFRYNWSHIEVMFYPRDVFTVQLAKEKPWTLIHVVDAGAFFHQAGQGRSYLKLNAFQLAHGVVALNYCKIGQSKHEKMSENYVFFFSPFRRWFSPFRRGFSLSQKSWICWKKHQQVIMDLFRNKFNFKAVKTTPISYPSWARRSKHKLGPHPWPMYETLARVGEQ